MALTHPARGRVVAALVGCVLLLDLLWSVLLGSTGSLAYAIMDEPAHLATCAVALLLLGALRERPLPAVFCAIALLASVAIDLDHIPGLLGSHALTGSLPRPYGHSLALVAVLALAALALRRPAAREACAGAAFGLGAHLLRDLATGPGVPLLWPVSTAAVSVPYILLAAALLGAAAVVGGGGALHRVSAAGRARRSEARIAKPMEF